VGRILVKYVQAIAHTWFPDTLTGQSRDRWENCTYMVQVLVSYSFKW